MRRIIIHLLTFIISINGWHDLGNTNYHCWPLSATAINPVPFSECPGINIEWIEEPPDEIKAEKSFNTSYKLTFDDRFWEWAISQSGTIKKNFFSKSNGGITDPTVAKNWCRDGLECPREVKDANIVNCCIYHVNVHSCPLIEIEQVKNGLCGPWIPAQGSIFTHSQVMHGTTKREIWTSYISGLYTEGENSIIAHFKVGDMHIAVEKSIKVLPKTVCGDDSCEKDDGEDCSTCPKDCGRCPLKTYQIVIIVLIITIIIAAFISLIGYSKYKQNKLLWDESWIMDYELLKLESVRKNVLSSRLSLKSANSNNTSSKSLGGNQIFTNIATYEGRTVAIKENGPIESFVLTKTVRKQVRDIRQLDHANIVRFVGASIQPPIIAIVGEYCDKGGLNDLLQSEEIPLNWSFRFSFAMDISKAMLYLHSKKIIHGNLKSSNCVVDDRWTVKVTDFGLEAFRCKGDNLNEEDMAFETNRLLKNKVYMAPELKSSSAFGKKVIIVKNDKIDVYAFSIILIEIATRQDPYGNNDYQNVPDDWKPPLPNLNPKEKNEDDSGGEDVVCPNANDYKLLIMDCWNDNFNLRPSFDMIKKRILKINPDRKSPIDMMMLMMEKYSKHLEILVGERTKDLEEEKLKTDRLLYSMLPKPIADQLRVGKEIKAEEFDSCTIYFSDIVGFTVISTKSTPIQVVNLLNKLYTTFDSIIDNFDVYKVETIGDAYMVVSGVPIQNGIQHVGQISLMSLKILQSSKIFTIPHLPDSLQIRVGLHSGKVCAGVVGLKMPRYCLFGDTVNTASRMESNGEAYKIHISETTWGYLQEIGGFECEERGVIDVKGKGQMKTFWLNGCFN